MASRPETAIRSEIGRNWKEAPFRSELARKGRFACEWEQTYGRSHAAL